MANPQIVVEYIANTAGLSSGMQQAEGSAKSLGGRLSKTSRVALAAAGAAGLGALVATLKTGAEEFAQSQKVSAQTEAVLKSTGKQAGVTAKQVSQLAGSLMTKSGVDDEAIQSGENLLLTFTRIRNETGKGNDIFNQATKIMLDMSVALGQDMKTSAIQVGKALNDPIKGISTLTRVGVSFTDAQKEQIKAMVAAGDTMGAQKVILAELTKEFGGSAEAAGKTLPGSLNILKESFNNLAGQLVSVLAPILQTIADLFIKYPGLMKAVTITMLALAAAVVAMNAALTITAIVTAPISIWFVAAAALIAALVAAVILLVKNWDTMVNALKKGFEAIKDKAEEVFGWIKTNWPLLLGIIAGPFGLAVALIATHWDKIENGVRSAAETVRNVFTSLKEWLTWMIGLIGNVLSSLGNMFDRPVAAAQAAAAAIRGALGGIDDFVRGMAGRVADAMGAVANAIRAPINAVIRGWNGLAFTVPKITIPSVKILGHKIGGGSFGGWTVGFPNIPLLAQGGVVSQPTLAMVGEGGGREIVAPEALLRQIVAEMRPQIRVFIGDTELRGLVRAEVVSQDNRTAQTLLAGGGF